MDDSTYKLFELAITTIGAVLLELIKVYRERKENNGTATGRHKDSSPDA